MFVTVIMEIMLLLLGIACGIATLNPFARPVGAPATGLSIGAEIWLMASWLVSVWVGTCVAGWMSGGPRRADGTVHGVVVWSFASAVILLLLTGTAGTLLSSSSGVVVVAPGSNGPGSMAAQGQSSGTGLTPTGRTGNQAPYQYAQSASTAGSGPAQPFWGQALYGFIALVLGLGVAAWGGATGAGSSGRTTVYTEV